MSDLPGGSSDGLQPANNTPGQSFRTETAVTLADFRFKKIGQPPALLQRMLASGSNADNFQYINSRSRSLSPDLEDELLLSDSSHDALNKGLPLNEGQSSLRARLAMGEPPIESDGNMDVDSQNQMRNYDSSIFRPKSTGSSAPEKSSPKAFPQSVAKTTSQTLNEHPFDSSAINVNERSPFSGPASIQRIPSTSQTTINHHHLSETSLSSETSTLKSLLELQSLLSSANLNSTSLDIADAIKLGQSIKVQCIDILSTSRNAHDLAQQSIASAQESFEASSKSLKVAELLQMQTDQLIAAIKRIESQRKEEWRNAIAPVATRLIQIVKDADQEEKTNAEAKRQMKRATGAEKVISHHGVIEVHDETSNLLNNNPTFHAEPDDALSRVRREASVASEELIRKREEAEARQRAAEEALRQRREAEELLEQQRQQAQADLALLEEKFKQAQTDRMEAEKKERLRQEEEIRIMRINEEEMARKEEQAAQLAIEERNKRVAIELQKQQNKLTREAALREQLEKEKLAREQDAQDEKILLCQQELKRQEIRDLKIRTSLETAKKIQATRARNPTQESPKSDSRASQNEYTNSSALVLSGVVNAPGESETSVLGEHHTNYQESKSSPATAPITINCPPQRATSVGVAPNHPPSPSKNCLPIGLPSPPFEETKPVEGHLGHDRARSVVEPTSGLKRPHEAMAGDQTQNTSWGSRITKSERPKSPSRSLEAVKSERASVEIQRHGSVELPLSSRPQTTPTAPNARKANLRKRIIKPEPILNVEVEPTASDYKEAMDKSETPARKVKCESPIDCHIPPLSMPSPSPDPNHIDSLPMSEREKPTQKLVFNKRHILDPDEESSSAVRSSLPVPGRHHASTDKINPTLAGSQVIQTSSMFAPTPVQSGSGSRVISSSLPAKSPSIEPPSRAHVERGVIPNINVGDSDILRMGPDGAIPNNLSVPLNPGPIEEDSLKQRRKRLGTRADYHSPSPPPPPPPAVNTTSRAWPRRGDHYSPRRSPVPRRPYDLYPAVSGPSWNRQRGPDNVSDSRDVSPGPPVQYRTYRNIRRSSSPEHDSQFGKKRNRETQDAVGPPSNRRRLTPPDNTYLPMKHNLNVNAPDVRRQYEADWSRTANYERSPPVATRLTPLVLRLDEAPDPIRLPSQIRDDQPRRRGVGSPYTHTAQSSSEVKLNPLNNAQHQNTGDKLDGPRPHLLDRFTDLPMGGLPAIASEPSHHFTSNKGPRPRKPPYQRPNAPPHQQPLEQRLNNKNSLIDRLQQP